MWNNYIRVIIRNMWRQRGQSFITHVGLSVAIASCVLIFLWVQDELRYDRFHENAANIYRVVARQTLPGGMDESFAVLPPNLAPALKASFPEVRQAARCVPVAEQVLARGERRFYESEVLLADPEFLQMFSFPLRLGEAGTALSDPHSIVLTERTAEKYFGKEDPLGKTVRLNNRRDCVVTGVLAPIPTQSHTTFDVLLPFKTAEEFGFPTETWERFSYTTYVLLDPHADVGRLNKKIAGVLHEPLESTDMSIALQALPDIHLHSAGILEGEARGDIKIVILFAPLALFILLMACINYLNLATAYGGGRAKEIGVRKVTGARRWDIVRQFIGESTLHTFVAMLIALLLIGLSLPYFNSLSGKSIPFAALTSPSALALLAGMVALTGIMAGAYPAFILSGFQPAAALRGTLRLGAGGSLFRKVLVVFQFTLTVILFVGSLVIYKQLNFVRERKLGFDKEHIVMLPLRGDLADQVTVLKREVLKESSVLSATAASDPVMMYGIHITLDDWEGRKPDEQLECAFVWCDEDYLKTHAIEMAQGQFFSQAMQGSLAGKIVLSEAAVRALGYDSPLGKRLDRWEIIGVVKDFHARSLHEAMGPVAMVYDPAQFSYLFVKIKPGDIPAALASVEKAWKRVAPDYPFEYRFLDQQIDRLYKADRRFGTIVNTLTLLALIIANLGLLGMASHMTARRTKEVGGAGWTRVSSSSAWHASHEGLQRREAFARAEAASSSLRAPWRLPRHQ